ncbi:hypothetical protein B0H19DRAFT_1072695 [Mycena capillaripes]|nr:hypothetical protein B0H19DRAFT_1072695 [Mycena capillaripes]
MSQPRSFLDFSISDNWMSLQRSLFLIKGLHLGWMHSNNSSAASTHSPGCSHPNSSLSRRHKGHPQFLRPIPEGLMVINIETEDLLRERGKSVFETVQGDFPVNKVLGSGGKHLGMHNRLRSKDGRASLYGRLVEETERNVDSQDHLVILPIQNGCAGAVRKTTSKSSPSLVLTLRSSSIRRFVKRPRIRFWPVSSNNEISRAVSFSLHAVRRACVVDEGHKLPA